MTSSVPQKIICHANTLNIKRLSEQKCETVNKNLTAQRLTMKQRKNTSVEQRTLIYLLFIFKKKSFFQKDKIMYIIYSL